MNGERIYVVGPTGADQEATLVLASCGFDVVTPCDPGCSASPMGLRAALDQAIDAALDADRLVLLPGWETSVSARILVITAASQGIPAVTFGELITAA